MARFVQGVDRDQVTLLPACVDDYVAQDNPTRVVDAFVDELDLTALGFAGVTPAATGRPGYHPATLLKLYLYGYLNQIPSSRRLEREAGRNVELMWLIGRPAPDFKTIADFRRENGDALRATCRHFVMFCRQVGLLTGGVVAVDGSRFKAVNTRDRNFTPAAVRRRIEQVETSIVRYLAALDTADRQEAEVAQLRTPRLKDAGRPAGTAARLAGHGEARRGRAGPTDLADRPRCAGHGDERQGHGPSISPNRARSKVRSAVETVFASQKHRFGLFVRTSGLARARTRIGLANRAHNLKRFLWIEARPVAA